MSLAACPTNDVAPNILFDNYSEQHRERKTILVSNSQLTDCERKIEGVCQQFFFCRSLDLATALATAPAVAVVSKRCSRQVITIVRQACLRKMNMPPSPSNPTASAQKVLIACNLLKSNSKRDRRRPPRAIDILQYLLEHDQIQPDDVEKAYRDIQSDDADYHRREEPTPPPVSALASIDASSDNTVAWDQAHNCRRRHVALRIYYDGQKYSGLAESVGSDHDASVEKALFRALRTSRLVESRASSGYSRCGRTDKGVSAAGQVVALRLKSAYALDASWDAAGQDLVAENELPKNAYTPLSVYVTPRPRSTKKQRKKHTVDVQNSQNGNQQTDPPLRQQRALREHAYDKILNNLLPDDIRVLGWIPVSDDFSARFSATSRTYRYFFRRRRTLDVEAMRQGLHRMQGTHDFRNFCKMDVEKVYNFERRIDKAEIVNMERDTGVSYFLIVGQAFLWHQIRYMASILFAIGQGLETPELVTAMLDIAQNPGKPAYPLADEQPLVLHDCGYPRLRMGYAVENLWHIFTHQESQWEAHILAEAQIRSNLESLKTMNVAVSNLKEFVVGKLKEQQVQTSLSLEEYVDTAIATLWNTVDDSTSSANVTWGKALMWMESVLGLVAEPPSLHSPVHVPILRRGRGTTYEEKLASLQNSARRCQRYNENIVKKRKSKEEDAAFYRHMTSQGGSAD